MSCSQSINGFRQSSKDCSALSPNWRDDLSWPSGWGYRGSCTSVYDYILDRTYDES